MSIPQIPVIRWGKSYESLDRLEVRDHRGGPPLAAISQANAGLIRRDMRKVEVAFDSLQSLSCRDLLGICERAGESFLHDSIPLDTEGGTQSPQEYVEVLSKTSGLPHTLVRNNMRKIHDVLTNMPTILAGLTRGLDLSVIDSGTTRHAGSWISFYPVTKALGIVLPSNSPGVNSIWLPAIPLKIPVTIKPGREEPWTPFRIIQSLITAGCPREAFGFYPTDHEGSSAVLDTSARAVIFGDENTVSRYANDPSIQVHGPGWSKIVIGRDRAENWPGFLDILVASIVDNGGRSCVNASTILTHAHGQQIGQALAERLAAIRPLPSSDKNAMLSAFANPAVAESINEAIDRDLRVAGAADLTEQHRQSARLVMLEGSTYLSPTLVACESLEHPLANREFLFPYVSVVEIPQEEMIEAMGPSLVVTALTEDRDFIRRLLQSPSIDRLNVGPIPTSRVTWDQPHEGNLFEFLYRRRAFQTNSQD